MKKIFVITLLVVCLSSAGGFCSTVMNTEKIIYVDDDNTQGPWDGTMEHPFQYVQDGINNALEGNTVFVYFGIYMEHLIIEKPIQLIGEQQINTILSAFTEKDIVHIRNTSNVHFTGFTIINTIDYENYLAGIHLQNTTDVTISNTIISGCYDGIIIKADLTSIKNNIIRNNKNGISFGHYRSPSNKYLGYFHQENLIMNNSITNNTDSGIILEYTRRNNITQNTIERNNKGVNILRDCESNKIIQNNLIDNTINAFDMNQNLWDQNFYDTWIGLYHPLLAILPKYIPGGFILNVDQQPMAKPYDSS